MKRILVLLSLIYFISCSSTVCNEITNIKSADDCLSGDVSSAENNCCYLHITGPNHSQQNCYEYPKTYPLEEIYSQLNQKYQPQGYKLEVVTCPADQARNKGSYLKTGILLLAAFLL